MYEQQAYERVADKLTIRIMALGPQILAVNSPWDLFKIDGFICDDIGPSLFQAGFALREAQRLLRLRETVHE